MYSRVQWYTSKIIPIRLAERSHLHAKAHHLIENSLIFVGQIIVKGTVFIFDQRLDHNLDIFFNQKMTHYIETFGRFGVELLLESLFGNVLVDDELFGEGVVKVCMRTGVGFRHSFLLMGDRIFLWWTHVEQLGGNMGVESYRKMSNSRKLGHI